MKQANNSELKPLSKEEAEKYKAKDIFVTRIKEEIEETKEGKLIKRIPTKINITKLVNETKKVIKTETAVEKVASVQNELVQKGVL